MIPASKAFKVAIQHLDDATHAWLLDHPLDMVLPGFPDFCDWCHHCWHAEKCATCHCDTARPRLDDTWRPPVGYKPGDQVRLICCDTGADGYIAQYAVTARNPTPMAAPAQIKKWLYGKGRC